MIQANHRRISTYCTFGFLLAIPTCVIVLFLLRREGHVAAAKTALQQYRFGEARAHLLAALQAEPQNAELVLLAAQTARRDGDIDEAKRLLEKAERLGIDPQAVELERLLFHPPLQGLFYHSPRRDFKKWEKSLWQLIDKNHPQSALILEALAFEYAGRHRREEALQCLDLLFSRRTATSGKPQDELPRLFLKAWLLECMGALADAELDFRRVVELDPAHDDARYQLGLILYATSRGPEAIKQLEDLQKRKPINPAVFVLLARCHSDAGNDSEAVKLLDSVLRIYPDNVAALTERGKLAFQEGQTLKAERWLRRAAKAGPWDRQANHTLYLCLNQQGKEGEAQALLPKLQQIEAEFEHLIEISGGRERDREPPSPDTICEIGAILLRNGQEEFGLYWLNKALELDPKHRPTHKLLADYYEKTGDKQRAAEHRKLAEER